VLSPSKRTLLTFMGHLGFDFGKVCVHVGWKGEGGGGRGGGGGNGALLKTIRYRPIPWSRGHLLIFESNSRTVPEGHFR
jgi:hypothetical protein